MNKEDRMICALVRYLARLAVRAEWKSRGRNPLRTKPTEIAAATSAYFTEHREELLKEAWDHPVAQQYREKERMKLARRAVIAEIRDKGRRVKSIAPEELNELIDAYLKEHPWEGALVEKVCF
jgi:ElaB/YqjD/DUF883 family membrane-anchored ribosome-binding protein